MALRVFISYTHETQEHMNRVWDLSERLRADGVDCRIDQQEESPIEGWPRWCRNQVQESQFVLIVSTAVYQRRYEGKKKASEGPGEQWESFVITQELYEAAGGSAKFIPVVLSRDDAQHIPLELRGLNYYDLSQPDSYDKLFRRLTSQPTRRPSLPPLENPFFTGREEVLDGLKKTLDNSGIAALTGLGGIGKTQIAAQYAH